MDELIARGKRFMKQRIRRGMSRDGVASMLGVDVKFVLAFESGVLFQSFQYIDDKINNLCNKWSSEELGNV